MPMDLPLARSIDAVSRSGSPIRRERETVRRFRKRRCVELRPGSPCRLIRGGCTVKRPTGSNTLSNRPGAHKGWDGYSPCT
jgi:hypothetical protein